MWGLNEIFWLLIIAGALLMIFKGPDIWKKWMAAIKDSKKEVDAIKSETSEQKQ